MIMKTIIVMIVSVLMMANLDKDCSDAFSVSDDVYTYAKKAYNSDSWGDVKGYLKKAMSSADDARSYASDCECDDAYTAADDSYEYAKKG